MGSLDFGLKKNLGKGRSIVFNASNVLNTMARRSVADLPGQNLISHLTLRFAQPSYRITVNWNFGKEKLRGKRERKTAEEEKGRVNR